MQNNEIDFVVFWVDGNDPEWKKKKASFRPGENADVSKARYREWDLLKYWFRAVEKYAPWVRKVFFVSDHQVPEWMNLDCAKLVHINHEDYIPNAALPLFNSSAIEIGIHRIPGLSEQFVLFNDDMFLTAPVLPDYYFRDGKPIDMAGITRKRMGGPGKTFSNILCNDYALLNKHFDKREVIRINKKKWLRLSYGKTFFRTVLNINRNQFDGLVIPHLSVPYLKSDFEKVWNAEGALLAATQYHRFREDNDINHFIYRYWRLCTGEFVPHKSTGKYISLQDWKSVRQACKAITKRKYPEVCLNDNWTINGFEAAKRELAEAWKIVLPEKSIFER